MCEVGKKFTNINFYNKEMQKGMEDKLFFINQLPQNQEYVFVDFGCADGAMINALTEIFKDRPSFHYIGYDISETMIDLARTNYHGPVNANVTFRSEWNKIIDYINVLKDVWGNKYKYVVILSSVIHEVYSYANDKDDIDVFWNNITKSDFDYVVIRDMCPSSDIDRDADENIENAIRLNKKFGIQLKDFENKWGSIHNNKNLIHFLLKCRWVVNWERELNENYFPVSVELLLSYFNNFNIDYFKRFRVHFLDNYFNDEFKIELNDYTHIKAIFTKKH